MRTLSPLVALLVLSTGLLAQPFTPSGVNKLTVEGLETPNAVDCSVPRFSWRLTSRERGALQSAYQLRVVELDVRGKPVMAAAGDAARPTGESGVIETPKMRSDASQWVTLEGFKPKPKTRYEWSVRVWNQQGEDQGWSATTHFDTGLQQQGWPEVAAWIGDGHAVPKNAAPAARYFRTEFAVARKPARAWLFVSALGIVDPWINGGRVSEARFSPGWSDYRQRSYYVAYDVTQRITEGANALGLVLGDGWYSGTLLTGAQAGSQPLVSAFLELTDAEGKVTTVATGKDWRWANGPITEQGIYHGETFDARLDDARWCTAGGAPQWTWQPVQEQGVKGIRVQARLAPPVSVITNQHPISRREIRPGVFIYDLGQNLVGWVSLKVKAPAGTEITLRMAEMLDADGNLYTANLRSAKATARYITKGEGDEIWEPRFTYFGFRYVELSGLTQPREDTIEALVAFASLNPIGDFKCSNPLLNKLYENTRWGQRGNFLEAPTDCPQRDERLGWTGDAQVFSNTANYNYACGAFYRQWLTAMRDGYRDDPEGPCGYPDVAPDIGLGHGNAGWGDAGVIVPYVTWLHTGDRRILEENIDAIQHWIDALDRDNPDGIRRVGWTYGDWCTPGYDPGAAPTPVNLISTAYFARVADIASRIAAELGREGQARRDRALFAKVRMAFQKEYLSDDGRITSDEQTAYLMALGFDLVPLRLREKVVGQLLRKFAEKQEHLATGFLGTPLVVPQLSATGHTDLAYRVLLQESYPGWLFSVKNGATTIWERWDSWTPEKGFQSDGMNSFNHYAYGSVVSWFYDTIAGLAPQADAAGWKRFAVAPTPGGGLSHARASVETPYGVAVSIWKIEAGRIVFEIVVPPNTGADVRLPVASPSDVTEGGHPLGALREARGVTERGGRVEFALAPGSYRFEAPWKE